MTAALVLGLSGIASAQQPHDTKPPFKVKPSDVDVKMKDSTGSGKGAAVTSARGNSNASRSSKDLQSIEREGTKGGGHAHASQKTSAALVRPDRQQATPKININGAGTKGSGARTTTDPYKGRLKQKGQHR